MAQEAVVQLKNVTKRYRSKVVVDRLSFDMYRGEIVGLLGPNGAGKTTTMRMMVGLISLTEGDVIINGHSIKTDFVRAVSHVGGVIENPEFYPFFSGYENLKHYANMYQNISEQRINEVVELIGLTNAIHKKVNSYSLGMRQRLGIAQALLHKPSVLILDEPTNGLDPAGIREMRDYFKKISQSEGVTILVSSHLLSEIELMCDRVVIIKNGKYMDAHVINNTRTEEQVKAIAFEVDDPEKAKQAVLAQYPEFANSIAIRGETIVLPLEREQITQVIARLIGENLSIYSVREERKNLEDTFLEKTGGNQIV
jgi:ABC-2 type transport system ATP-binding protein